MNEIEAYGVAVSGFTGVMYMAYRLDKWLEKRSAKRRLYNDIDITGLYARNNDVYSFAPVSDTPQLVMCGGCGHNIEPGNCPGADKCVHFNKTLD